MLIRYITLLCLVAILSTVGYYSTHNPKKQPQQQETDNVLCDAFQELIRGERYIAIFKDDRTSVVIKKVTYIRH